MEQRWLVLLCLIGVVAAQDEDYVPNPETQNYQYRYYVNDEVSGDIKSHEEKKIGDTVTGEYTVGEPTGDLRVVTYTADEGGFRANVKYEEGGSPLSNIQDKSRQTSPVSGYSFQWLPGNPDEPASGKAESVESNESSTEGTEASEAPEAKEESVTPTAVQAEVTPEASSEGTTPDDDDSKESAEKMPETKQEEESKSEEKESEEPKGETESKEDSAEAAGSAPYPQEVAPTEPNAMYLPPYQMEGMPFYLPPSSQQQEDRPTIIYASQNFYNPWQWFGPATKVPTDSSSSSKEEPPAHYMTGLGYIIVPPRPQQ